MQTQTSRDIHVLLFFVNLALVIAGYGINTFTNHAYTGSMKLLRVGLLGISLALLGVQLLRRPVRQHQLGNGYMLLLYVLFLGAFFTLNLVYSLNRVVTFVFPFLYIYLMLKYALARYGFRHTMHLVTSVVNWTYAIPLLIFILVDRSAMGSSFLADETKAFVRNHYGWSGTIFLLTTLDLLTNYGVKKWRLLSMGVLGMVAVFVFFASGSRSSWMSVALTLPFFLLRFKQINWRFKPLALVLLLLPLLYFIADEQSALYARWNQTQMDLNQGQKSEKRLYWMNFVINEFNESPRLWITGRGFFNYDGLPAPGYHNSYFDILFGTGVVVFAYFMFLFVFRPLYYYARHYSVYFMTFFPLVIIPYFEDNLTGGQFLFFPWFTYMLLYSVAPRHTDLEQVPPPPSPTDAQRTGLIPRTSVADSL